MAAHQPRAKTQCIPLGVHAVHNFVGIDSNFFKDLRRLVHECYIDIPLAVFYQLDRFSSFDGGDREGTGVNDPVVDALYLCQCFRVHARNDFSDGAQRMDFVARIDAFRRISDLEVCAALQSTFLLQDRQTELLCHAGVDRALIDHRCAQLQVTPHRTAGRNDRGQIRGIVRVDRRRNCHNDEIRLPELRFLCCKMNRAGRNSCITHFCCHVLALAVTCNFLCINIISDHIHALRKGNCQRQAHIAQTDHSQLAFKSFCLITHFTVPPFRIT